MSFTTHSTFSTNYQSLGSVQVPSYGAWPVSSTASVYAGTGGSSSRISVSHSTSFQGGMGGIQNEKETMQNLNDHLASYLNRVRNLEMENWKLESKIWEHLEKKGPHFRDWSHYFRTIKDLRAQIFTNTVDNAYIVLQIDSACLAADDFKVKYETELIASSGLTVEDLVKIMADIWAQYDKVARKNQEQLDKYWSQQIEESTTMVITQPVKVGAAEMTLMELRCTVQSLEIDLDSMRNLKASLENSLREVETHYALQMEQLNGILLYLESELAQTREYEALRNIKVNLEAEIATYRRLLEEGKDFNLGDALDSSNSMQTIQKTTTCLIVDGEVVSETDDTKVLKHEASRSRVPLGEQEASKKFRGPKRGENTML
uniref:IF rod domain-containing protein n=1 Tax=Macaca nemestrina TaxID=9545 RepID=A0A2K6CWV0_MACNE